MIISVIGLIKFAILMVERPGGCGFLSLARSYQRLIKASNGCPARHSGLRGKQYAFLGGVRIKGPIVLVTYPGNAVI